ncbi:MAG: PQQ-binding-like beta-propeller repeat protein [Bdellovibrionales bacterium]|nr:PQQ-binding-like beta-propeller repeat protein [Bdellovibrionales bacterium]
MRASFLLLILAGCSSVERITDRLEPVREGKPVLSRGWAFVESEEDYARMNAGQGQFTSGSPVIAGEKVIFGSDRFGLMAVNKYTGQKIWRRGIPDGVSAQILVLKDRLYVGGDDGVFRCLDVASGAEAWATNLGLSVQGQPLLLQDRIVTATMDDAVHALDPQTGKVLWSYRRSTDTRTKIHGGGNPTLFGGKVWVGFSDGSLLALDPRDGAVSSEQSWKDNSKFHDVDARPVAWRGGLLVVSFDGKLRFLGAESNLIWEFPAGGARSPVIGSQDRIFLPSSDGAVYAIRGANGKELWKHVLRKGVPTGAVLVSGQKRDLLVVATSEEKILALDPDTGAELGSVGLGKGSGSFSSLTSDGETGSIFLLSSFSRLYQLRVTL